MRFKLCANWAELGLEKQLRQRDKQTGPRPSNSGAISDGWRLCWPIHSALAQSLSSGSPLEGRAFFALESGPECASSAGEQQQRRRRASKTMQPQVHFSLPLFLSLSRTLPTKRYKKGASTSATMVFRRREESRPASKRTTTFRPLINTERRARAPLPVPARPFQRLACWRCRGDWRWRRCTWTKGARLEH